jgi:hypothetical protein
MLRRKPTAITVTHEDIASYEDRKRAEQQAAMEQAAKQEQAAIRQLREQNFDPNTGEPRPRQKTREERLGLGGRS